MVWKYENTISASGTPQNKHVGLIWKVKRIVRNPSQSHTDNTIRQQKILQWVPERINDFGIIRENEKIIKQNERVSENTHLRENGNKIRNQKK